MKDLQKLRARRPLPLKVLWLKSLSKAHLYYPFFHSFILKHYLRKKKWPKKKKHRNQRPNFDSCAKTTIFAPVKQTPVTFAGLERNMRNAIWRAAQVNMPLKGEGASTSGGGTINQHRTPFIASRCRNSLARRRKSKWGDGGMVGGWRRRGGTKIRGERCARERLLMWIA